MVNILWMEGVTILEIIIIKKVSILVSTTTTKWWNSLINQDTYNLTFFYKFKG